MDYDIPQPADEQFEARLDWTPGVPAQDLVPDPAAPIASGEAPEVALYDAASDPAFSGTPTPEPRSGDRAEVFAVEAAGGSRPAADALVADRKSVRGIIDEAVVTLAEITALRREVAQLRREVGVLRGELDAERGTGATVHLNRADRIGHDESAVRLESDVDASRRMYLRLRSRT